MAATNIFYRIPSQRGTRVASIAGTECTLDQFCNHIFDVEGLNRRDFIIASGTKVFRPSSCNLQSISLQNNSNVDILIPLLGGKGGFGSLLRAIGAQIEKTTNRDACRDLSGRRLRDIKREDELRKLIELKAKLEDERKRRKQEKLEKLKKNSETSQTCASIQELVAIFDDHSFNKRRLEIGDIIDAAVEKGLINSKKRQVSQADEQADSKKARPESGTHADATDRHETHTIHQADIAKATQPSKNECTNLNQRPEKCGKRKDLWLGLEDDDLGDVSEEDEDEADAKAVVVVR